MQFIAFYNLELERVIMVRTAFQPLRITAGYGHDSWNKGWFSLRFDHFNRRLDKPGVIAVLMNYGCAEEYAVKAVELLEISGRYDCCVQRAWFVRRHLNFERDLNFGNVSVVYDENYGKP